MQIEINIKKTCYYWNKKIFSWYYKKYIVKYKRENKKGNEKCIQ